MTTSSTTEERGLHLTIDDASADGIAGSVYRELRAAICDFRLEPNQRLVQNNLADQLGISRTPVRDALMRLAQEGLVHPSPQRGGYLVSEFTARHQPAQNAILAGRRECLRHGGQAVWVVQHE